jgi:hypothetical protein
VIFLIYGARILSGSVKAFQRYDPIDLKEVIMRQSNDKPLFPVSIDAYRDFLDWEENQPKSRGTSARVYVAVMWVAMVAGVVTLMLAVHG